MSKWIDIKNKLPDESNTVTLGLVYDDDSGEPEICICSWGDFPIIYFTTYGERFIDFNKMGKQGMNTITHWMPLPDMPE